MKVSLDRWKEANKSETQHWENITRDKALADREDGYYRHAEVMFLQRDNPHGLNVVDIGGGPLSLMLHHDLADCMVVDPISPNWEYLDRYTRRGITFVQGLAEEFLVDYSGKVYDEVWMYNCLQHTVDPELILDNLYKVSKVLRVSEPTNTPINLAHPHSFTPEWLHYKLKDISIAGEWNRVDYDYPYCGGKYILK